MAIERVREQVARFGYEIREYETLGEGKGNFYEIWKDGILWGFCREMKHVDKMIAAMVAEREHENER